MTVKVKRVYEPATADDGMRVLVDRLWPRGISKDKAKIALWLKEIAPSNALRKWYGHDPAKWTEFRRRYAAELKDNPEPIQELRTLAQAKTVTLLFSSKELELNNAVALKEMLRK